MLISIYSSRIDDRNLQRDFNYDSDHLFNFNNYICCGDVFKGLSNDLSTLFVDYYSRFSSRVLFTQHFNVTVCYPLLVKNQCKEDDIDLLSKLKVTESQQLSSKTPIKTNDSNKKVFWDEAIIFVLVVLFLGKFLINKL
jgi:hypothetical protein